jgi:hypothetical protein
MNINRDNYEEFFLLYADNELPADQRRAVEEFVENNADLKEEFRLLNNLRLEPDTSIYFGHKESLLQPVNHKDDTPILTDDEEKILRYIDLELNAVETTELKLKLAKNHGLQSELDIFYKTKLQPDLSIVFPDKSLLYRNTKDKGSIIRMTWVRIAVAATLLLIAGLFWINNSVEESTGIRPLAVVTETSVSGNTKTGIGKNNNENSITSNAADQKVEQGIIQDQPSPTTVATLTNVIKTNPKPRLNNQPMQQAILKNQETQELALMEKPTRQTENITTPGNEHPLVRVSPELSPKESITEEPLMNANVKSNYATEALMSAQDAVEVVTMEDNNKRKSPIRGIVRKANRLYNKVTNPDFDKPRIRVANFEIALAK